MTRIKAELATSTQTAASVYYERQSEWLQMDIVKVSYQFNMVASLVMIYGHI
jgi:hypothetical protein